MSWRDQVQNASFRGVPFHWEETGGNIGRRVEVHPYPKRDIHWSEDMGLSTSKPIRLRAFVLGNNYMAERDRLIEALNKPGAGTLIHPRMGAMQVIALDDSTWTESTRNGGMTTFDLVFVLAGEQQYPSVRSDTVSSLSRAVNSGLTAVENDFNDRFKVTGFAAYILDTAQRWYGLGLDILSKYGLVTGSATRFLLSLAGIRDSFLGLIRAPRNLAQNAINALKDLIGESDDIQFPMAIRTELQSRFNAIDVYADSTLGSVDSGLGSAFGAGGGASGGADNTPTDPSTATTASRVQQFINRDAIIDLYHVSATLLTVESIAQQSQALAVDSNINSPFDSYNHAIAVRDELTEQLDIIAETASDELYDAIRDVQAAFASHIEAHGFQLERIATYAADLSLPALVAAHSLYADASREADIVRRNNIAYPNFIPSGVPLEVLDA